MFLPRWPETNGKMRIVGSISRIKDTFSERSEDVIAALSYADLSVEMRKIFEVEPSPLPARHVQRLFPVMPFERFHGQLVAHAYEVLNEVDEGRNAIDLFNTPLDHLFVRALTDISFLRDLLVDEGVEPAATLKALDQIHSSIVQALSESKVDCEVDLSQLTNMFDGATQQALFHQIHTKYLPIGEKFREALEPLNFFTSEILSENISYELKDRVRRAIKDLTTFFKESSNGGSVESSEESDSFKIVTTDPTLELAYFSPLKSLESSHDSLSRCKINLATRRGRFEFRDGLRELIRDRIALEMTSINPDLGVYVLEKARANIERSRQIGVATYLAFEALSFTYQIGRRAIFG